MRLNLPLSARPRSCLLALWLAAAAGCASAPPPVAAPARAGRWLPADAWVTQRAILTVHDRQFPLNGYLAVSRAGGARLVVTESFGHILADVLVKPDGAVYVLQSSRLFSSRQVCRSLVPDLECLLDGGAGCGAGGTCPVQAVGTNHFRIQHRAYTVDLRLLEVKPGPQRASLFDPGKVVAR